jgi:NADH dehydrogenase [ubiquinone] 1 alpha subcomplex assembly factor 7
MADFMRMALTHPEHGYYTKAISKQQSNRDDFDNDDHYDDDPTTSSSSSSRQSSPTSLVIGADFVTAPEVSSVFGECIGVWFVTQWNRLHQPNDWQFLELGPGKGSLMVDLLRFTRQLSSKMQQKSKNNATDASSGPMFGDGCRHIHFIEQSPVLRQRQREDLVQNFRHEIYFVFDDPEHPSDPKNPSSSFHGVASPSPKEEMNRKKHTIAVHWHDSFNAFRLWQNKQPSTTTTTTTNQQKWLPTFVIGQEFLDALPIYAFEKTEHGVWRERMVDVVLREDLNKELQEEQAEALRKDGSMPSTFTNPTTSESTNNGTGSIEINTTTTTSEETTTTAIQKAKPTNKLRLRIVLAPEATPALKMLLKTDADGKLPNDTAPAGAVVEVCPEGILLVQDVASMLEVQGGAALFIDYGSAEGSRDSLRGFSRHQQVHFLSRPGEVDITADVDFLALQHAINSRNDKIQKEKQQSMLSQQEQERYSTKAYGPTTQGEFLMAIGIQERVINLMESESVTDQQAEDLYQALVRLASPKEMGERYKVMAIATKLTADASEDAPPGFS